MHDIRQIWLRKADFISNSRLSALVILFSRSFELYLIENCTFLYHFLFANTDCIKELIYIFTSRVNSGKINCVQQWNIKKISW